MHAFKADCVEQGDAVRLTERPGALHESGGVSTLSNAQCAGCRTLKIHQILSRAS